MRARPHLRPEPQGAEIVRRIREKITMPVIADIHFSKELALGAFGRRGGLRAR